MPNGIDFVEETEPASNAIDFQADETLAATAVQVPQAVTGTVNRLLELGGPGSEMARARTSADEAAQRTARYVAGGGPGAGMALIPPVATPPQVAQGFRYGLTIPGRVANAILNEERLAGGQGIAAPPAQAFGEPKEEFEQRVKYPLGAPGEQLFVPQSDQPSDVERWLAGASTIDDLLALPIGTTRTGGKILLATMLPGVAKQITDIAAGPGDSQDKLARARDLVVPALVGLAASRPRGLELLPGRPEAPPVTATGEVVPPPSAPLEFTGAALPSRPAGAVPTPETLMRGRPTGETFGPPQPRRGLPVEVPATEAGAQPTALEEIRANNAQTTAQIQKLFPQLSREESAQLRNLVWGKPGAAEAVGVTVSPTIPRPTPMEPPRGANIPAPELPIRTPLTGELTPAELEQQARDRGAIGQQIITWERELDKAIKNNDAPAKAEAIRKLTGLRLAYEGPPATTTIRPKPGLPALPRRVTETGVPGTPAEPRETALETIRKANARTRAEVQALFPQRQLTRQEAGRLRDQAWGIQKPPEEPPAAPPAAPTPPTPPAPPTAPAAPAAPKPATPTVATTFSPETIKNFLTPHDEGATTALLENLKSGDATLPNTEAGWKLGMSIRTPEQLRALKEAWDAAKTRSDKIRTLPVEERFKQFGQVNQSMFLREAYEAATGTGSAFTTLSKIPGYKPPFPEGVPTPPPAEPTRGPEPNEPAAAEPSPAAPTPPTEPTPPATFEQTAVPGTGKTIGEWEGLRDASGLPKGDARAALAKWLAVPNQPSRILQALANKKRTREIHAPPMPIEEAAPLATPAAQPTPPSQLLFVKYGNRMRQVSAKEASEMMDRIRGETGKGASELGQLVLYDAKGNPIGHVSYNGNVWYGTGDNLDLIHNATGLVKNAQGRWDIPEGPRWRELTAVQDKLQTFRQSHKSFSDASLAADYPEFAKLIKQRDEILKERHGVGGAGTIDVTAETEPAEPETKPPVSETPPAPVERPAPVAKAQAEVSKVAATEGQRSAKEIKSQLVSELEAAHEAAPASGQGEPKQVVIDIPGDGVFTINNTKEALAQVLARAKRIKTEPPKTFTESKPSPETRKQYIKEAEELAKSVESGGFRYVKRGNDWWEINRERRGEPIADEKVESKALISTLERKASGAEPPTPPPEAAGPGSPAYGQGPDNEVLGLDLGSPAWNRLKRQYDNFYAGLGQLFKRRGIKRDLQSVANAASNLPKIAGLRAGESVRARTNEQEQNGIAALMQSLKMSGEGLSAEAAERLGQLEFAGDPTGYLETKQRDMETLAQQFRNQGKMLEAQSAAEWAGHLRYARENFNRLKPLAEFTKRKFDRQLNREQAFGINTAYENWYVPQRHEIDLMPASDRPIVLADSRGAGPSSTFKKAKVFEDYASAIEAGFIPRTFNIADLLEHRVAAGEKLITGRGFFDQMREIPDPVDGKPIVMDIPRRIINRPDGSVDVQENIPVGYSRQQVIGGAAVAVHDGYARLVDALTARSQLSQSAIFGTLQNIAAVEKHLMLALDTFHASRTMQAEFALTGKLSIGARQRLGRALVEYSPSDLDAAVQKGAITQEMADYIRTPQQMTVNGQQVAITPHALINLGIRNGLNIARFGDVLYKDWLREMPYLGAVNKWVFDKLTRSAMAHGFLAEFERIAAAKPELTGTEVARQVARDINVLFGNLGKESIFRNPSLRSITQVLFLAPQWVEALARREGRAVLQVGEAGLRLAQGKPAALGSAAKTVGTGLALYFVGTQLLNLITRQQLTFQNKERGHKLDAWIPGGKNGYFISPLSVFAEVTHDILRYAETKPDLATALSQIGANKLGNLGRFLEVLVAGRDPITSEKIVGTGRRAIRAGLQLAPVPIIGSNIGRVAQEGLPAALPSFGVKVEPAGSAQTQVFRMADDWKRGSENAKYRAEVERRQKEDFGPSDYREIRTALGRNDLTGARRAYDELRQQGKTPKTIRQTLQHPHPFTGSAAAESRFRASLNQDERELYNKAIEERRQLYHKFQQMLQTPNQ